MHQFLSLLEPFLKPFFSLPHHAFNFSGVTASVVVVAWLRSDKNLIRYDGFFPLLVRYSKNVFCWWGGYQVYQFLHKVIDEDSNFGENLPLFLEGT